MLLACASAIAQTGPGSPSATAQDKAEFAARAEKVFLAAKARFAAEPTNGLAAWQFGRACYDWADYATSSSQRAGIAQQGINACRSLIAQDPSSGPGHYYLGMNLGQLAQTKSLGALRIVGQMESEFTIALGLAPALDFAGPDRNLGLLYFHAPGWPTSIGSKAKARQFLQKALKLYPNYPENQLNLIEAEFKWGDKAGAVRDFKALEAMWPAAHKELTGVEWASSWADWETRRQILQRKVNEALKGLETPRQR
jgi:tetratricopeptide (TPR) repeat protein